MISQEVYKDLLKCQNNDGNTTRNLSDYSHYQKCHKVTGIDLSRHTNTSIPQQINFIEN